MWQISIKYKRVLTIINNANSNASPLMGNKDANTAEHDLDRYSWVVSELLRLDINFSSPILPDRTDLQYNVWYFVPSSY